MIVREKDIKAKTYREFADRVLEDVKGLKMLSLVFSKSSGNVAVFRDQEGNRIDYIWEKSNVDLSD